MSYPNYPNPARRARILEAQQLRQQGLTLRQIAKIMGCAHSTVAGYLRDYELFRLDLMHELAADQIVTHAIHLSQVDSDHHDRRLSAMREFRLLLTALPEISRAEGERTGNLNNGSVHVDRYGNRYPVPNRLYPPTEQEQLQSQEPPKQLPAGRPNPDVVLYCPPLALPDPEPASEVNDDASPAASQSDGDRVSASPATDQTLDNPDATDQIRTESNKTEQESATNPAHDGDSADSDQNSPSQSAQTIEQAIARVDRQLEEVLRHRDWLNDYPQNNPWHPERQLAQRLVEKKQALLDQLAAITEDPAAA